jgi:hypothetical protein
MYDWTPMLMRIRPEDETRRCWYLISQQLLALDEAVYGNKRNTSLIIGIIKMSTYKRFLEAISHRVVETRVCVGWERSGGMGRHFEGKEYP